MPDQEVVNAILTAVASGEPAHKAAMGQGLAMGTWWYWLGNDADLAERYARAKLSGLERWADEILAIADEPQEGVKVTTKADGSVETVQGDMLDHRKLRVDSRKWLLSKLAPKKYGDKIQTEHSGSVSVSTVDYSKASE